MYISKYIMQFQMKQKFTVIGLWRKRIIVYRWLNTIYSVEKTVLHQVMLSAPAYLLIDNGFSSTTAQLINVYRWLYIRYLHIPNICACYNDADTERKCYIDCLIINHYNGKVVKVADPVVTGDVEACLQRLQWRPGQPSWRNFRFCTGGNITSDDMAVGITTFPFWSHGAWLYEWYPHNHDPYPPLILNHLDCEDQFITGFITVSSKSFAALNELTQTVMFSLVTPYSVEHLDKPPPPPPPPPKKKKKKKWELSWRQFCCHFCRFMHV